MRFSLGSPSLPCLRYLLQAVSMQLRTEVNEGNEDLAWLDDTGPLGGFGHRWVTNLHGEKVKRTAIPVLCCLRCLVVKVNSSGLGIKPPATEWHVGPTPSRSSN